MTWVGCVFAIAATMAACGPALAQTEASSPAPSEQFAPPSVAVEQVALSTIRVPAGTVIQVEITEALSSETSQQEQLFGLRLAEPIIIDGREVVPAGALGGGEVIDAHPSAFGGRPGRLIISGRYIEIGGQRARIRAMQVTRAGEDRVNAALAVGIAVGLPAYLIQGGEVHVPVGTRAAARLAVDVDVPIEAVAAPAAANTEILSSPAEAPTPTTSGENQQ
ncbi:MAG: hypothetical protein ACT4OF_05900 [Caulobacteraceae bacterium]